MPLALAGCGGGYLSSDEARQARDVSSDEELRQALRIFNDVESGCTDEAASGTVRNRATTAAEVVIEVRFVAVDGSTDSAETSVEVGPDATGGWTVGAPDGASSAGGCQPAIKAASRA